MDYKIGFIGAGNMGGAIIKSLLISNQYNLSNISVYDVNVDAMNKFKDDYGINTCKTSEELVSNSDIIILAVKPHIIEKALKSCVNSFTNEKILVSIAVGVPISYYKNILGDNRKVIRTMPNTPALIAEGMTLVSYDNDVNDEELDRVLNIFSCTGKVEIIDEHYMNEVTALTGSSPAYVYMFIEAMADAAVLSGLPRDLSYKLASQAVVGSAKMVLETGLHPGKLKDMVCSPAGTTIEAVASLEKNGFRNSVIEAMNACTKRAREIGNEND